LNSGKFKLDMMAGKTVTELLASQDECVRMDAAKWYTARRMGWKETVAQLEVLFRETLSLGPDGRLRDGRCTAPHQLFVICRWN
jgi:hypothetical protein